MHSPMSTILYIGAETSLEEKNTWILAVITVGVSAVHFATVLGRLPHADVTEIAYIRPMLSAIDVAIALLIVAHIVVAIAAPKGLSH